MDNGKQIAVILGHPDPDPSRLCSALVNAYMIGARAGGHHVRRIDVAELDFPWIKNKADFEDGPRPPDIVRAQDAIHAANHLVLVYPLWHGTMPALMKAFIEQVFRYDFAFEPEPKGRYRKLLTGRSARVAITMGMPALAYRFWFRAHSLKNLERNVLKFSGIGPIRESLFGMVEDASETVRANWLQRMERLGQQGA